ncbi:MAG: extracellular solute-binding protein [Candidatus Brocadiae bacterium]|nr:extracellular solute-binding protein [Candidatus Brocadiia bacterium]
MKSLSFLIFLLCLVACEKKQQVVVYTALDRNFSEPILRKFEEKTGIQVKAKYDTESTKTVGLTACLIEESKHPRCDVFWNNEIVNTLRLKQKGILAAYISPASQDIPEYFKDKEGYWTGFAARARVLIVNTEKVKAKDFPVCLSDLAKPEWKGRFAIAKPVAGTTATHFACLFSILGPPKAKEFFLSFKANQVRIESGNKSCAEKVGSGELDIALTDTDDAMIEILQNRPVKILYPDSQPNQSGTLFIPNTLALIANSPNPENAKKLISYLLSPEVEEMLSECPSAQIPLNPKAKNKGQIQGPDKILSMPMEFSHAAKHWEATQEFILKEFLSTLPK